MCGKYVCRIGDGEGAWLEQERRRECDATEGPAVFQERKTNINIKFWAPCKAPINVNSLLKGALQGAPKLYVYVRFSFSMPAQLSGYNPTPNVRALISVPEHEPVPQELL